MAQRRTHRTAAAVHRCEFAGPLFILATARVEGPWNLHLAGTRLTHGQLADFLAGSATTNGQHIGVFAKDIGRGDVDAVHVLLIIVCNAAGDGARDHSGKHSWSSHRAS